MRGLEEEAGEEDSEREAPAVGAELNSVDISGYSNSFCPQGLRRCDRKQEQLL